MPFPQNVREEALVFSARHCCVCHRYKGVKVEVHHIIQEADGGPNTPENAIALCADCHTDAGHYNPRHPRGTKFSPTELRLARDTWHEIVRNNSLPCPSEPDSFYCRYVVCKNFEAIGEVVDGNLSDFPFDASLLARTPAFDFLSTTARKYQEGSRNPYRWGGSFQAEDEYLRAYPDAQKVSDTFFEGQQWLQYERFPTADELHEKVAINDYISRKLLEGALQPADICKVIAYTDGCGDVLLQEEYLLRPLWVVYLVITNESDHRVRLTELITNISGDSAQGSIISVDALPERHPYTVSFPSAEIPAKSTVVLPMATMLGPIGEVRGEFNSINGTRTENGQMQELSRGCFLNTDINSCLYWGPVLSSPQLHYRVEGMEQIQEIHELDLRSLYVVDRYWMMGSCPHIFSIDMNGKVSYLGEIFADRPDISHAESISIEKNICWLVVAELEDEKTYISSAFQKDTLLVEDVCLEKGDYLVIPVSGNVSIIIRGWYELLYPQPIHAQKNYGRVRSLIRQFAVDLSWSRLIPR